MGWLITLGIAVLVCFLPLGICVRYNAQGPRVRLIVGLLRFLVYPRKKKDTESQIESKENQKAQKKKPKAADAHEKSCGKISDFFPLVRLILDFLVGFRRKLRVNSLELKVILAGGDPCDLAINYGRAWIAVGNLFPQLERVFVIKKRDVEVECDFTSSETKIYAHLDFTITVGRILSLSVWHGTRILYRFIKILNMRKGGMNNESKSS